MDTSNSNFKKRGSYDNFQNWTNEIIEVEKNKSHKLKQKIKSEKNGLLKVYLQKKKKYGKIKRFRKLLKIMKVQNIY